MMNTTGPPIDEATILLVQQAIIASATSPHLAHQQTLNTFAVALQRWNPNTILDITISAKPLLDFLFTVDTTAVYKEIRHGRFLIHKIVHDWMQSWNRQLLTSDELQYVIEILQTDLWDTYQDIHMNHADTWFPAQIYSCSKQYHHMNRNCTAIQNFLLPTVEALQSRIMEVIQWEEILKAYMTVEVHRHTYQLCKALGTLKTNFRMPDKATSVEENVKLLQQSLGPIPKQDLFYHLTYFNIYPSILFNGYITEYNHASYQHEKCIPTISHALSTITQSFGSNMTFGGVVDALAKLNSNTILNSEIKILLNNERLEITSLDITNFRAVKLLHDISKPIQGFIKTCVQYKFQVVGSDTTFSTLQTEVTKFYASKANDRDTCLSFLDQLYNILCSQPYNDTINNSSPHVSLLHKISKLIELVPTLLLMSHVFPVPKLWQYFQEMRWFTNENRGALQFDQDYNSLMKAVSCYGALQEALIVESLKPVAHFFIAVQTSESCPSIKLILTNFRNDNTIQATIKNTATIQLDIILLNSRLISIKDLFRNVCNLPTAAALVRIPQPNESPTTPTPPPVQSDVSAAQPQLPERQSSTTYPVPQPIVVQSTQPVARPSNHPFGFTFGPESIFAPTTSSTTNQQPETPLGFTLRPGSLFAPPTTSTTNPQLVTQPIQPIISQPTVPPSKIVLRAQPTGTGQSTLPHTVNQLPQVNLTHFATPKASPQPRPSETAPSMTTAATLPPTANGRCTINIGSKVTMNGLPLVIAPEPASAVPQPTILPPSSPAQPTVPPSKIVLRAQPTGTGQSSLPYQVHQRSQVNLTHFATPQESPQPRPSETAPSMTTAATLPPTANGRCTINIGSKVTMNGLPLVIAPEPASAVPQPTILPPSSPAVSMSTTPPIQSTTTQPSSASGFTFSMDSGVNLNGIYIFQFGSSAPLASTPPLSPPPDPMTQAPAASTAVPPPNSGTTLTFGSGAGGFQVGSSHGKKLTPRFRRR